MGPSRRSPGAERRLNFSLANLSPYRHSLSVYLFPLGAADFHVSEPRPPALRQDLPGQRARFSPATPRLVYAIPKSCREEQFRPLERPLAVVAPSADLFAQLRAVPA